MKTPLILLAAAFAAPLLAQPAAAQTGDGAAIEVVAVNVRSNRGAVRAAVCTRSQFLKVDCLAHASVPAQKGVTRLTLPAIPPGAYAIQVFHDANVNRKVDQIPPFGIPLEDIGFSRDAPIRMAPPKWADAVIEHGDKPQTFTVRMRRLR